MERRFDRMAEGQRGRVGETDTERERDKERLRYRGAERPDGRGTERER